MEKEMLIDSYTAIPNFAKLGFQIMAFSFYSWRPEATEQLRKNREVVIERLFAFLKEHKNVIFTSNGQGFEMERMMMSVHKSYGDYVKLMKAVADEWGDYLLKTNSFIISLQEDVVGRKLGFGHFGEYLLKEL